MSDSFTPTTVLIRDAYEYRGDDYDRHRDQIVLERSVEFDRWLAERDESVRKDTLESAAADVVLNGITLRSPSSQAQTEAAVKWWLLERAARVVTK